MWICLDQESSRVVGLPPLGTKVDAVCVQKNPRIQLLWGTMAMQPVGVMLIALGLSGGLYRTGE